MKLDVIIPCYNEEGNLKIMFESLTDYLKNINYNLIFVNDGSTDNTENIINEFYKKDPVRVKVLTLSRNFGKDAAMYAGLKYSTAEYAVLVDGDCQHNPKYLTEMLDFLENNKNYDAIAMVNKKRKVENIFNRILKRMFYNIINKISDTNFVNGASDFRMFRRPMVEAILTLEENNRFSKGLFSWVGFNTYYKEYKVEPRLSGRTSYGILNQFRYASVGIFNFSVKPIKAVTTLGFFFAFGSFIYLLIIIAETLITGIAVPGYASLICVVLMLGGIQLIAIGIIGEYVAKAYLETKKRPIYIIKNKLGITDDDLL